MDTMKWVKLVSRKYVFYLRISGIFTINLELISHADLALQGSWQITKISFKRNTWNSNFTIVSACTNMHLPVYRIPSYTISWCSCWTVHHFEKQIYKIVFCLLQDNDRRMYGSGMNDIDMWDNTMAQGMMTLEEEREAFGEPMPPRGGNNHGIEHWNIHHLSKNGTITRKQV